MNLASTFSENFSFRSLEGEGYYDEQKEGGLESW